jgi:serine/threonine protein kinase
MIDVPHDRDPVERLADEFAERCRQDAAPSWQEYAARYPEYAPQIEELFPTVALMEQLRAEQNADRETAARRWAAPRPPEHLGDFRLLGEIGRGGMGIVYEAEQRSLGRHVAVKLLPKHSLLLDRHLKRFQHEAQTAARLLHTNIVPVFGAGEHDGLHYYVMPLVRGVGLDEVIRKLRSPDAPSVRPALGETVAALIVEKFGATPAAQQSADPMKAETDWRDVARVGLQAAEALEYAHGQGTLHRDIKPGNLLVDTAGTVLVADFGLARAVEQDDASRSVEVVGTPRYMAPEQRGGTADARSDVYSLGATLYELLTLRTPAPEPIAPRQVDTAIPRDLETVILKCLARQPARRYPTAAALAADLRRFLEDRPIQARRSSPLERAWRWCRRNPALAGVSTLAALLLAAVAMTAAIGHLKTRQAYAEARTALARAEITSRLSLDVLENIYLQLSPDRVWIASDSTSGAGNCRCVGLNTGAATVPIAPSEETAALLANLLVFYDRLAEQGGNEFEVLLESAIAGRRVGDIQQRLGRLAEAERQYVRAGERLAALQESGTGPGRVCMELARTHNEIGNLRSARLDFAQAGRAHRAALAVLDAAGTANAASVAYRYELARTLYFLATKPARGNSWTAVQELPETWPASHAASEYRKSAVAILESLAKENPAAPDYRFLLALCYRSAGAAPTPAWHSAAAKGRQRAIEILEDLRQRYPGVADYRYELMVTYAWVPVGLFPWQRRTAVSPAAEESLRKALAESQWLTTHHPAVPQYACAKALLLAKLGMAAWSGGRLDEADGFLRQAVETQSAASAAYADAPGHNRVLLESMRLRWGQVCVAHGKKTRDPQAMWRSQEMVTESVTQLVRLSKHSQPAGDAEP